jgi:hypothetical protein
VSTDSAVKGIFLGPEDWTGDVRRIRE